MISQVLLVMNNDHFHFSSCVNTHPAIILIRYCELLYFANIPFFDDSTKHFLKKHNNYSSLNHNYKKNFTLKLIL